jgi:hypothetical protein
VVSDDRERFSAVFYFPACKFLLTPWLFNS